MECWYGEVCLVDKLFLFLCEKPMYWDEGKDPNVILARSREMADQAEINGRVLGVSAQYLVDGQSGIKPDPTFKIRDTKK